jgi:hypothetical protein
MMNKSLIVSSLSFVALWAASAFTPLAINSLQLTCWLVIASVVLGTAGFGRAYARWSTRKTIIASTILTTFLFAVKYFLVWGGDWKTQTILYQSRHSVKRVIVFQMQDVGALGYNKRTVDKTELLPGVSWFNKVYATPLDIPQTSRDSLDWRKVDIDQNELGLKFP